MEELFKIINKKSSSFFIVEGDRESSLNLIKNEFKNEKIEVFQGDLFTVDTASKIIEKTYLKEDKRFFLIMSFYNYGLDGIAQNYLLKTLEKEKENLHIFILVDKKDFLINTVLSRAIFFRSKKESISEENSDLFDYILNKEPVLRLNDKKILKIIEKSKEGEKYDKEKIQKTLEDFILYFIKKSKNTHKNFSQIDDIINLINKLKINGSSVKNIFEYILLTLPKIIVIIKK